MTQFQTKIATAIATGAVLLSSVAPAFAADTIVISDNGKNSNSNVGVSENNTNTVSQTNSAVINNNTTVNTNTGGNKANDNLGDVHVTSGDAKANVNIQNQANSNVADVGCNCDNGGAQVVVSGNLKGSENNVGLSQDNANTVFQTNAATVNNNTNINSNTGKNKASDNLGDVHLTSGQANASVNVGTAVNSNVASIGGGVGAGSSANPGVSAYILGNGKNTDNNIGLSLNNSAVVSQTNDAHVNNNTDINQNTGKNKTNDNLGDVYLTSGNAGANVNVDTMANFNAASLDCGCAVGDNDVFAKIGQNLQGSDNNIGLDRNNAKTVFQTSAAYVGNNTVDNANTGDNQANDNGYSSSYLSDPHVDGGNASSNVNAQTSANSNVVGPSLSLPGNGQVSLSWDMSGLSGFWAWMMSH